MRAVGSTNHPVGAAVSQAVPGPEERPGEDPIEAYAAAAAEPTKELIELQIRSKPSQGVFTAHTVPSSEPQSWR